MVKRAPRLARADVSLEEILAAVEDQILRTHVFAALDTLEFLRRSGRMNTPMAGIGSLLQVKPILRMYDGKPNSQRVWTRQAADNRLLALLEERLPVERIAIVHTHAEARARDLLDRVAEQLPASSIPATDIMPVIGAHIGPGAAGFALIQAVSS